MTSIGDNVRVVVTDLGILEPREGELTLVAVHPGVTADDVVDATGWDLRVADDVHETAPPTAGGGLAALRMLETKGNTTWQ